MLSWHSDCDLYQFSDKLKTFFFERWDAWGGTEVMTMWERLIYGRLCTGCREEADVLGESRRQALQIWDAVVQWCKGFCSAQGGSGSCWPVLEEQHYSLSCSEKYCFQGELRGRALLHHFQVTVCHREKLRHELQQQAEAEAREQVTGWLILWLAHRFKII